MKESKWNVVLEGNCLNDDRDAIVERVQKAFNVDRIKAESLLNGKPKTIKKGLNQAAAYTFKSKLLEMGVSARLEKMKSAPPVNQDGSSPFESRVGAVELLVPESQSDKDFSCPKCGTEQVRSRECSSCGIVFDKFLSRQKATLETEEVPKEAEPAPATLSDVRMARARALNNPVAQDENNHAILFKAGAIFALVGVGFLAKLYFFDTPDFSIVGPSPNAQASAQSAYDAAQLVNENFQNFKVLLDNREFDIVESELFILQQKVEQDLIWETTYQAIVDNISYRTYISIGSLDRWVGKTDSAFSYLARGSWYINEGNKARGNCYSNCTSDEQFAEQARLHREGVKDLQRALDMNPRLLPAYSLLMNSHASIGVRDFDGVYEKVMDLFPGAYHPNYQYMRTLLPRWGGSYLEMGSFIKRIETHIQYNPRLNLFKGYIYADKGSLAYGEDDCNKTISFYKQAMEYGVDPYWSSSVGVCLADVGRFKESFPYLNLALHFDEEDENVKAWLEYAKSPRNNLPFRL